MTFIRSSRKKKEIVEDMIIVFEKHKADNYDDQKTGSRLSILKKKYDLDFKKMKLGDLL